MFHRAPYGWSHVSPVAVRFVTVLRCSRVPRDHLERLPMKLDTDGTVRVFASFNRNGTTKTYFRADNPSCWQRQPGKPVQTPPWVSQ